MMKHFRFLAVALTAVGLVSTAAAGDMAVDGKMRMRMEQKGTGDEGSYGRMEMGAEVNMKFTPDPMLTIMVQPKFYKIAGFANTGSQGAATSTSGAGTLADGAMDVHQAYFTYTPSDKVSYTLGRHELKYGDELVIGPVGWSFVGRSWDGVKIHWTASDMIWVDFIWDKITEATTSTTTSDKEHTLYGIYAGAKLTGPVSEADLYYLINDDRTGNTEPKTTDRSTLGVRVKGATGAVDYRAEYTTQSGSTYAGVTKTTIDDASNMDVEVGFKTGDWRVSAEFASASKNYFQMYPTGHKWLGFADLFGRRNIKDMVIGVKGKVMEHMGIGFDYHKFSRTDTATAAYALNGTTGLGTTGTSDDIGSEMDLTLSCTKMKALTWTLGYSLFTGGDYWKSNQSSTAAPGTEVDDKVTYAYLMGTATF